MNLPSFFNEIKLQIHMHYIHCACANSRIMFIYSKSTIQKRMEDFW